MAGSSSCTTVSGHPIIPTGGHRKFPTLLTKEGSRYDGDIVDGRDGGHGRHWPRGHTTRGGTHGSGGLLARGASAVTRGEAVEVRDRPAVAARSQDGARTSRRARDADVRAS